MQRPVQAAVLMRTRTVPLLQTLRWPRRCDARTDQLRLWAHKLHEDKQRPQRRGGKNTICTCFGRSVVGATNCFISSLKHTGLERKPRKTHALADSFSWRGAESQQALDADEPTRVFDSRLLHPVRSDFRRLSNRRHPKQEAIYASMHFTLRLPSTLRMSLSAFRPCSRSCGDVLRALLLHNSYDFAAS